MKNNLDPAKQEQATNNGPDSSAKAALYDPYLDTLGGGEKHILSILKTLEAHGITPHVFWDKNVTEELKTRLNIEFKSVNFMPNIFKDASVTQKLSNLREFDYFFYVTDGSYFASSAKHNYVFAMVPKRELYQMGIINKIKLSNFTYITNSDFTKRHLAKWGIRAETIYPYVDTAFFKIQEPKKNYILTVGRFFGQLHNKKHDLIVKAFEILQNEKTFKNFKLILAGSVKKEDQEYLSMIKKLAAKNPAIEIKVNVSFQEIVKLYQEALVYWHFTGFGIDEEKEPEKVEHLGLAPLEAMASGCMTFSYKAGGPKEFIENWENGFLFENIDELIRATRKIVNYPQLQEQIQKRALKTVMKNFTFSTFKKRVEEIILQNS